MADLFSNPESMQRLALMQALLSASSQLQAPSQYPIRLGQALPQALGSGIQNYLSTMMTHQDYLTKQQEQKRLQDQAQREQEKWGMEKKQWAEPITSRSFTGFDEPSVPEIPLQGLGAGMIPLQSKQYGVDTTTTPGGQAWEARQAETAYKKAQTEKALREEKPKVTAQKVTIGGKVYYLDESGNPILGSEAYIEQKEPSYSKIEGQIFVKWLDDKPLSKPEQQIVNNKFTKEGRETPAEVSAKTKARWIAKIEAFEQALNRKPTDDEKRAMFISDPYGLLGPAGLGGSTPNLMKYDSTGERIQ